MLANAEHSQRTSYAMGKLMTEFFMRDAVLEKMGIGNPEIVFKWRGNLALRITGILMFLLPPVIPMPVDGIEDVADGGISDCGDYSKEQGIGRKYEESIYMLLHRCDTRRA